MINCDEKRRRKSRTHCFGRGVGRLHVIAARSRIDLLPADWSEFRAHIQPCGKPRPGQSLAALSHPRGVPPRDCSNGAGALLQSEAQRFEAAGELPIEALRIAPRLGFQRGRVS